MSFWTASELPTSDFCLLAYLLLALTSEFIELVAKALNDGGQLLFAFRSPMCPLGGPKSGFHHSSKWSENGKSLRTHPLSPIFPPFRAPPDSVDGLRILLEFLFAGGGKSINAPSLLAFRFYETLVLELLER